MKKEDLKFSFEQIKPDESAKRRMLQNILNHDRKKGSYMINNFKKVIPALALVVVLAGGLLTYSNLMRNNISPGKYNGVEYTDTGREDAVAPLLNQFQIDNKHYILLSDDLRADYGMPAVIDERDIGEKIADITTSPDASLVGSEVFSYVPAGGDAVVAVKKDNNYQLFRFFTFESYNNNQDEDAVEYLKLHGINKADDILIIQFISHSEQSKLQDLTDITGEITDRDEINQFYSYYSVLKNSSDKYFDRLFNFSGSNSSDKSVDTGEPASEGLVPPDYVGYGKDLPMGEPAQTDVAEDMPLIIDDKHEAGVVSGDTPISDKSSVSVHPIQGGMDTGNTGYSVGASQGSVGNALDNPITIRIYNQSGVYYDSMYYRNIGFISRYEISKDFSNFISRYVD